MASSQISPGAHTCVIVGDVDESAEMDLTGYRSVLWFTHEPSGSRTALPSRDRVHVTQVTGVRPNAARKSIDELIQRDPLHLPSIFVTNAAVDGSAGLFQPVIEAILSKFEIHEAERISRHKRYFQRQGHLLANLSAYCHRRVPPRWEGKLAGHAAIVCGPGASLEASLSALRYYAERAVIFASASTLRSLARIDVTADFAVVVDDDQTPEQSLTPGHPSAGRVILAGTCPASWQYSVSEHKLHFLSGHEQTEEKLTSMGIPATRISINENCDTTALALALHFGCGPIYLLGMEGTGGETASKYTAAKLRRVVDSVITTPATDALESPEIAAGRANGWHALDANCAGAPIGRLIAVTDQQIQLRNISVIHPASFAIPESPRPKDSTLSMIAMPDSICEREWRRIRDLTIAAGKHAADLTAQARTAFEAGHIQRGAELLARPFRDKRCNFIFGNYSQRIVPHLTRFNTVDAKLWPQLLDECSELTSLALNQR